MRLASLTAAQYAELRRRIARATRLSGTDLDEVVHGVLDRLYRADRTFGDEEHLYACALLAARHMLSNERRRAPSVPLDDVDERALHPAASVDPAETAATRGECRRVLAALRRIGPRQRQVVYLHDVRDHSRAEVAAALGLTVGAVDVALHRGRHAVRRMLTTAGSPGMALAQVVQETNWRGRFAGVVAAASLVAVGPRAALPAATPPRPPSVVVTVVPRVVTRHDVPRAPQRTRLASGAVAPHVTRRARVAVTDQLPSAGLCVGKACSQVGKAVNGADRLTIYTPSGLAGPLGHYQVISVMSSHPVCHYVPDTDVTDCDRGDDPNT